MKILNSDDLNVVSEESVHSWNWHFLSAHYNQTLILFQVFRLMETWVSTDFQLRKIHIPKLIRLVRMPLLDVSFLETQSQLNKLSCNRYFVQDVYNSLQVNAIHMQIARHWIWWFLLTSFWEQFQFISNSIWYLQTSSMKENVTQRCSPKILCAAGGKSGLFATLGRWVEHCTLLLLF